MNVGIWAVVGAAIVKAIQIRAIVVSKEPRPFSKLVALGK